MNSGNAERDTQNPITTQKLIKLAKGEKEIP